MLMNTQRKSAKAPRAKQLLASKVTARAQTTLPSGVRKALGLEAGDQNAYTIEGDQAVIRKLTDEDEADPVLAGFLKLLERDIVDHPERIQFATQAFATYLEELTAGIEVDYDAPIEGDFQL
jgi:antitoxin PrlF